MTDNLPLTKCEKIGALLGTGYNLCYCITACSGQSMEPGTADMGMRRWSLLACKVLVHFKRTEIPGKEMVTSPLVRLRSG